MEFVVADDGAAFRKSCHMNAVSILIVWSLIEKIVWNV